MGDYNVYWGDFHTHINRFVSDQTPEGWQEEDFERADARLGFAKDNIDFCGVLCYPFFSESKKGLRYETVRNRPEFLNWWEYVKKLTKAHHEPARFITFLGYEWHGDRTRWGDHNVIYFGDDEPLDDAWSLDELYANLRKTKAFALPHHTAYCTGWRGKDWDVFDGGLSPVMEVFSGHGSSEGCDTPFGLKSNLSMGPRTKGGSYQDALARGLLVGAIGSNDGDGLPGRWECGRAAVLAKELTRESLWEAIAARRTYAVTGDRIMLDFQIGGAPMGSVVRAGAAIDAEVSVVASNALDRIELVHNGVVVDTYCHSGKWERAAADAKRFKVFIEAGWGPSETYGLEVKPWDWDCTLGIDGGAIVSVEKCFSLPGQKIGELGSDHCRWEFGTGARAKSWQMGVRQGLVFELDGTPATRLTLTAEGETVECSLGELLGGGILRPLLDESKKRIFEQFGVEEKEMENPDRYFHNARKIKLHRAVPESSYRLAHTFRNIKLENGRNYFYTRISQLNGQYAWSSPIWVDSK